MDTPIRVTQSDANHGWQGRVSALVLNACGGPGTGAAQPDQLQPAVPLDFAVYPGIASYPGIAA
jgi:hypothetical protein